MEPISQREYFIKAFGQKHASLLLDNSEKKVAAQLLSSSAIIRSTSWTNFCGMLITGFGAMLTLLLTNWASLSHHIRAIDFKLACLLFLAALLVYAIMQLTHSRISNPAKFVEEAEKIGNAAQLGETFDFDLVSEEIIKAHPWIVRWIVRRDIGSYAAGDFMGSARMQIRLNYLVIILGLAECAILVTAGYSLVRSIA